MKRMILFVSGLGIVFLASAVQTYGTNWLGQGCRYPGPCFHPEWLAMGIGLSAVAYIAWKRHGNPPKRVGRSFFSIFALPPLSKRDRRCRGSARRSSPSQRSHRERRVVAK
jgi:hypothetical protein